MSLLVPINGQNFILPEPNEVGWGSNLDDFFVAISNGVLQKTGGSFTLSAETDFGASYGLKSLYYKSRASNVAATGAIRLANAETGIVWRNALNNADLALTVNSSNQLSFNGTPIVGNTLSSAHILVGNASNIATDVAMTGDISIDNTGLTAIGSGKIVNAQVNASAAIAYSKLALTGSIVNADVNASAAIAYSKLALTGTVVNADISASAAIAYSKLNLVGSVTNADLAGSIAYSKLVLTNSVVNADISSSAAIALSKLAALGTAKALQSNAATGAIEVSSVTNTELGYVSGVTSALQTQLDAKMPKAGGTFSGDVTYASGKGMFWTDSGSKTVKLTSPTTLTNTYALKWPLDQGGANQYLTNDGSGNLSWTNAVGTGTVNSGTQYQLGYYATTTNAITGLTLITGSRALASDANGLPVAATTTATELGYVNGVTSAIQTQMDLKAPLASPTFTGVATFANGLVGTPSVTLGDATSGLYRSGANQIAITTGGGLVFLAEKTDTNFYASNSGTPSLRFQIDQSGITSNNSARFYTSDGLVGTPSFTFASDPDCGAYRIGANNWALASGGVKGLELATDASVAILGTTTSNNATAGWVGETVLGNQTTLTNFPTSTQWGDLTSISLTAGDWLVWGVYNLVGNGGTTTECNIAITTTSGNSTTGFTNGLNNFLYRAASLTGTNAVQLTVPALRFSLSAPATVYLKYEASWSTTAPQAFGNIRALRVR